MASDLVRRWIVRDAPNGLEVWWTDEAGEPQGPICHMRWTDGLRADVTARVKEDAELLASAPDLQARVAALEGELERDALDHQRKVVTMAKGGEVIIAQRDALRAERDGLHTDLEITAREQATLQRDLAAARAECEKLREEFVYEVLAKILRAYGEFDCLGEACSHEFCTPIEVQADRVIARLSPSPIDRTDTVTREVALRAMTMFANDTVDLAPRKPDREATLENAIEEVSSVQPAKQKAKQATGPPKRPRLGID